MGFVVNKNQIANPLLASQQKGHFYLARGNFAWFDEVVAVTAYVMTESAQEPIDRLKNKEHEEILIGTELLLNCRLEIDFVLRTATITRTT
jgi:hypothetical protein